MNVIYDITGFGWSGSGAVIDLLREYDDVQVSKEKEFAFLYNVDGIKDLEYKLLEKHCRIFDSDVAIKRFLYLIKKQYSFRKKNDVYNMANDYIKSLTGIEYKSRSIYDSIYFPSYKYKLSGFYNYLIKKTVGNKYLTPIIGKKFINFLKIQHTNKKYLSYNPLNFIEETLKFTKCIFEYINDGSNRPIVTDHLFPPDNPTTYFKYIGDRKKCIIVRRDPRDTYILAKEIYRGAIPLPVDTVEDFIWFYKHTIEEQKINDSENILNINFEDLIYNYGRSIKIIESFLNIHQHCRKRKFFNPLISINNTRLYTRFDKYDSDIKQIEIQLQSSLYPFDDSDNFNYSNTRIF